MDINAVTAASDWIQAAAPIARTGAHETTAASPAPAETGDISPEQVENAVQQIEQFTRTLSQNLKFSIDEDTGKTVVKIVDAQTQEVIRQMPSEEALSIARTLGKIQGVLFNGQA